MVELEIEDYQKVKTEAEHQIKQATIMLEVNTVVANIMAERIKELTPPEEKKPDADTA